MTEKAYILMSGWSLPELTVDINTQIQAKMQTSALLANTVDICSDYAEQHGQTLILGSYSLCKTDDSGYHTSLTPGSLGCSEISGEYLDHSVFPNKTCSTRPYIPSEVNIVYNRPIKVPKETIDTPLLRPGVKRSYQKSESSDFTFSPIPTPTTLIAGKIQSLDVNENKENSCRKIHEVVSDYSSNRKLRYYDHESASYPITPVKKNCKLNPCRKSAKKLNFVTHSLSCEPQELLLTTKKRSQLASARTVLFQPEKKFDILRLLYKNGNAMPPISTIFNYLSNEDIYNMKLVSATWAEIWESVSDKKRKQEYEEYIKSIRENQENRNKKGRETQFKNKMKIGCFREIHNELYHNTVCSTPISPPGTPKSERFKKFTKVIISYKHYYPIFNILLFCSSN